MRPIVIKGLLEIHNHLFVHAIRLLINNKKLLQATPLTKTSSGLMTGSAEDKLVRYLMKNADAKYAVTFATLMISVDQIGDAEWLGQCLLLIASNKYSE